MNLISAIGVVLSLLPVPAIDRAEPNRAQRLESIAIAISRASERATCMGEAASDTCKPIAADASQVAAELIVIANEETALRSNVHSGHCLDFQCDPTKHHGVVTHRARSLWQLHRPKVWSDSQWESILGSGQEATDAAAWTAAKILAGGHGVCHTTEGAVTFYAVGGNCHSYAFDAQATRRAKLIAQMRGRIQRLMTQQPKQGGEVAGR